ncbi:unnamed protein product [Tenebrio molitor]|nr:unnamed protein product [Tenebrio molitor]
MLNNISMVLMQSFKTTPGNFKIMFDFKNKAFRTSL